MYRARVLMPILLMFLSTGYCAAQETTGEAQQAPIQDKLSEQVQEIGNTLNQSETAREVATGILKPIYDIAEYMSFPAFYWIAFALMVAGVVSFAFQLLFSKFFLLFKMHLNVKEILADILCLLISLVGLVLTTQAATQNSNFPESPVAVLSATGVGALVGLIFYWWGQKQEFQAAHGIARKQAEGRE